MNELRKTIDEIIDSTDKELSRVELRSLIDRSYIIGAYDDVVGQLSLILYTRATKMAHNRLLSVCNKERKLSEKLFYSAHTDEEKCEANIIIWYNGLFYEIKIEGDYRKGRFVPDDLTVKGALNTYYNGGDIVEAYNEELRSKGRTVFYDFYITVERGDKNDVIVDIRVDALTGFSDYGGINLYRSRFERVMDVAINEKQKRVIRIGYPMGIGDIMEIGVRYNRITELIQTGLSDEEKQAVMEVINDIIEK